jgi:hypothetical protein
MQTREQTKNWKVVASVATVAALGVSGLAIATPGDPADTPPPIEIQDSRQDANTAFTTTTNRGFEVVPSPSFTLDDSIDSPLASADIQDSPDSSPAISVQDSPDSSPAASVQDSPGSSPAASVEDSPDSADSPPPAPSDSVDSVDSVDSADSVDSGDSVDSLDS